MKLYANDSGEWVGTQAEAKKIGAEQVDVPVDKPSLLAWLNGNKVGAKETQTKINLSTGSVTRQPAMKQHPWQSIREMAEQASLRDLGVALAVVMNRLEEAAEREEIS